MLAKVAQQHGAAAAGRLDQARQRIETFSLACLPPAFDLGDARPGGGEIARGPQHDRQGRIPIAARPAGFLIIGLDRFRDPDMGDEADVGLVDPHAECDRRDHHHVFRRHEGCLVVRALFLGQTRMVGAHLPSGFIRQFGRQFLRLAASGDVDDARTRTLLHQMRDLAHGRGTVIDLVTDVRPIEARQHEPVGRNAELRQHVLARALVRRRRQREAGNGCKAVEQGQQPAIVGAEIVPPFGHAMRFVDGEQRQPCA